MNQDKGQEKSQDISVIQDNNQDKDQDSSKAPTITTDKWIYQDSYKSRIDRELPVTTQSQNPMANNTTQCFPYSNTEYQAVTILSACVAVLSALACILVTTGIIYSKKYLFFTQRLILYLSIAATLNATAVILRLHSVVVDNEVDWQSKLCMASGFLEQVTTWSQLLAISCITLSVFVKVVCRGSPKRVEPLFPAVIFLFPISINWIPFIDNTYGRAGAWCWIRDVNSDCSVTKFGQYLRFALWFVPLYVILFVLVVSYFVILCKIHSHKRRWQGRYDPDTVEQRAMMKKEVWPLLWYPAFYIVLNIFPLANRLQGAISPKNPVIELWILQAIFSPLQGGFVSVAYALDSETFKRLNCWKVLGFCCRKSPKVREYHHENYPRVTDSLLLGKSRSEPQEN